MVHGGDCPNAFCYSLKYKTWACYTRHCERETNAFITGLVQQVKGIGFLDAVKWLCSILGISIDNKPQVLNDDEKTINLLLKETRLKNDITNINVSLSNGKNDRYPFQASKINGKIKPSQYFLDQGFSEDVLIKYNVGFCDNPNKPMYLRSYVPVLSDTGDMVVGSTGRIIYEKCEYCPLFHENINGCPKDNPRVRGYSKWFHDGFNTSNVLYNYNFASSFINESKVVIICESTKNIWWLEQHNIHNSLSIFGLRLSKQHLNKLIQLGPTKLVLALDKDDAGIEAIEELTEKLENYFQIINIHRLMEYKEDIANIKTERMQKEIVPFLKNLELHNNE